MRARSVEDTTFVIPPSPVRDELLDEEPRLFPNGVAVPFTDLAQWLARVNTPSCKVPADHAANADSSAFTDRHGREDHGVRTDHDVLLDRHARDLVVRE